MRWEIKRNLLKKKRKNRMEGYIEFQGIKTTKKHFELFKKECLFLQNKWGLNSWELYFSHEEMDNCYAKLSTDLIGRVAKVDFSAIWPEPLISDKYIKIVAKHEMIHLVLARLYTLSLHRFLTESELEEANEETVRVLEKIIS